MKVTTIQLDGALKADLDWTSAKEAALQQIDNGQKILWELHLGLFESLVYPFSHQSQFLSLGLSIDHFIKDIWPLYSEHSIGVSLYNGPADYRKHFPWDAAQNDNMQEWLKEAFKSVDALEAETTIPLKSFDEATRSKLETTPEGSRLLSLFCRDACVEYLNLLAANIPDEIPLYVQLDCSGIDNPAFLAQLTTAERYERLSRLLSHDKTIADAKAAICLPPSSMVHAQAFKGLDEAMEAMQERSIPYKIIPEASLITEWDELDALIVCPKGLGPQGFRKLQGFCAAGGLIVVLGDEPLGLPHEVLFDQWI